MKRMFFLILVGFVANQAKAQLPRDENNKVTYTEVVEVSGSKEVLFTRVREWMAKTFVSSESVIDYEDKEAGKIVAKGILGVLFQMNTLRDVRVYMTFEFKDGKYRYIFTDFVLSWNGDYPVEGKMPYWGKDKFYQNLDIKVKSLITDLKNSVNQTSAKSDW